MTATDVAAFDFIPALPTVRTRHIVAVTIGNALEFYDFLIYSYFAVYIGQALFPAGDAGANLLASLATFGAGFLTRPIGAIVIGTMGDRVGRKPAMILSFTLMGVGIVGLALTPSYAAIGIAAPILALLFRLLQGFALGGEMGPATAFLTEAAPPNRRGFYIAMQASSQALAQLIAGVAGTGLALLLSAENLADWGWRLAMLIGAAVVPFGLIIRRDLPETAHDEQPKPATGFPTAPSKPRVFGYAGIILLGLMMLVSGTIGTYVNAYMTTYALTTLHMAASASFGIVIVRSLVQLPLSIVSGTLSDRFGRRPVMLIFGILLFAAIVPTFSLLVDRHSIAALYSAAIVLSILAALYSPTIMVTISEALPKNIRSGTVGTVYALATSVFGGTTQFIVAWLVGRTGNPLAPAYYWTGALAVGLAGAALIRETAPRRRVQPGLRNL